MARILWLFLMYNLYIKCVIAEETTEGSTITDTSLETNLQEIEHVTALAEKSRREVSSDRTNELYDKIALSLGDLIDLIDTKNNTYTFFNLKGINRIVIPNIRNLYAPLRMQLLLLLKTLFNNAPASSSALIPMNIVDMLLDVFENDDNLALKAHALDILYLWLPSNPKLQARVMKLKGLEPFYEQIAKLDSDVIYKLLDLFNTILEEHLNVRYDKEKRNKYDNERLKFYQMIGLVERMSTPTVCNGILNIFKETITYSENNREIFVPVMKIAKNIKPFCMKLYKGKNTPIEIFKQLRDYFKDVVVKNAFEDMNLNVTEIELTLSEYYEKLRENFKDEF